MTLRSDGSVQLVAIGFVSRIGNACQADMVSLADESLSHPRAAPSLPAGVEPTALRGPRFGPLAAAFALASAIAGLGASLPIGSGSSAIGGYDIVAVLAICALIRGRAAKIPESAIVTWAIVLLLVCVATMMPFSPHYVIRTAALLVIVQTLRSETWLVRPVVLGLALGAIGQVLIGLVGYARAGTVLDSPEAFGRLADHRSGFDWLAGESPNPPLSASGLLRMQGLAGHPNELAVILAISSLLVLYVSSQRLVRIALFVPLCVGTVLTMSRFAVVALLIGVLLRPTGRTGLPGRVLAIAASGAAVLVSMNPAIRDRLFDLSDEENAQGRSSGPLDLLDDATILPDQTLEVRHNSIAFMLDHAGLLLGSIWVALLLAGLIRLTASSWTRDFSGVWIALAILFLTEDRIQSPSFLMVVAATSVTAISLTPQRPSVPRPQHTVEVTR